MQVKVILHSESDSNESQVLDRMATLLASTRDQWGRGEFNIKKASTPKLIGEKMNLQTSGNLCLNESKTPPAAQGHQAIKM